MNIRTVGIIFILSILLLLTFQAVWLYNTYNIEEERIQTRLMLYLQESVKKELLLRLKKIDNEYRNISVDSSNRKPDYDNPATTVIEIDIEEGLGDVVPQYLLSHIGLHIDMGALDSIFSTQLNYQLDYLICYKDSTNQLLDSIGKPSLNYASGVFASDSIPIVNKSYVQLFADISMPVVLKQMVGLTIASFLMLVILIIALIVQIRYAYNQYHLNKLRDDFSHALIHDLKSPLNTIYIALSNYKNGLFEKNSSFYLKSTDVALLQVLNIQALVDRILSIARFEEKKMEVVRSAVNLPKMIGEIVDNYSVSVKKAVVFETSFHLNDKPVYMDEMLIRQAISNLVDNAIKYSGDSVKIEIACEEKENKVYIQVKDNGIGISPKYQELIFNKFERGGAIFRRGAKGFGLGLNYVKHVALAHQGTVACYSRQGEGSTFTMLIPSLLREMKRDELAPLETAIVSH